MLISTLFLVATQLINACLSTRLPLGLYELKDSNGRRPALATAADFIPKDAEYSKTTSNDADKLSSLAPSHSKEHAKSSHNDDHKISEQHQLDRRRRRQTVQQPSSINAGSGGNVQILYAVGSSENDLDICKPNQVCSKINLYQTPWIQRQCRCPPIETRHHHGSNPSSDAYLVDKDVLLDMTAFAPHDLHLSKLVHHPESVFQGAHFLQKRQSPHIRHSRHTHRQENIEYINGCSTSLMENDGHTIVDKTKHYKLCSHDHSLPTCQFFHEPTWIVTISRETNATMQIVYCKCPENSVAYLTNRIPMEDGHNGYSYFFACSPVTNHRCQRKNPCRLFTVQRVQGSVEEVNINNLCECPTEHHCPTHHNETGVISSESYVNDNVQTYGAFCTENE